MQLGIYSYLERTRIIPHVNFFCKGLELILIKGENVIVGQGDFKAINFEVP